MRYIVYTLCYKIRRQLKWTTTISAARCRIVACSVYCALMPGMLHVRLVPRSIVLLVQVLWAVWCTM